MSAPRFSPPSAPTSISTTSDHTSESTKSSDAVQDLQQLISQHSISAADSTTFVPIADDDSNVDDASPTSTHKKSFGSSLFTSLPIFNRIRAKVSKKKRRFKDDDFNLDLTYVTPRIIAMGFPSESLEGMYRNHYDDVYEFFEIRHQGRYKIFNLCIERTYPKEKFHGRVSEYGFEDHNPPPLEMFEELSKEVHEWLSQHPENVVAIHCKAGKGRTGSMIVAYLVYSGRWRTALGALAYYGAARTKNNEGVTILSQRRFVQYFEQLCYPKSRVFVSEEERKVDAERVEYETQLSPVDLDTLWTSSARGSQDKQFPQYPVTRPIKPSLNYVKLTSFTINGLYTSPKNNDLTVALYCGMYDKVEGDLKPSSMRSYIVKTWHKASFSSEIESLEASSLTFVLWKEVRVLIFKGEKQVGSLWFHTSFVGSTLELKKHEIDKMAKDVRKEHKKYARELELRLTFEKATRTDMIASMQLQRSATNSRQLVPSSENGKEKGRALRSHST